MMQISFSVNFFFLNFFLDFFSFVFSWLRAFFAARDRQIERPRQFFVLRDLESKRAAFDNRRNSPR